MVKNMLRNKTKSTCDLIFVFCGGLIVQRVDECTRYKTSVLVG